MMVGAVALVVTLNFVLTMLVGPLAAEAQEAGKVPRIGILGSFPRDEDPGPWASFEKGLRELGYVDGQNIALEWRWAHGRAERYPDLAAELVRLKVDIIVVAPNPRIQAAQRATRTIPIVMVFATDPVRSGFVASLARPGANITGLSTQAADFAGKRLQLLKEAVPGVSRFAVLWDPGYVGTPGLVKETEIAAQNLGP